MAGYIGTTPVPQATQHRESFTATGGQTSFATAGYTPQFIDVYLNGVKLAPADFTATNGSDVVLASGATASDILEIVAYTPFEVANQTFTGDTSVTNLAVTGTFTSRGIDDNADAVAITIDSSENVGIGTSSPVSLLHVISGANGNIIHANGAANAWDFILKGTNDSDTESALYELGMYRGDGSSNPNTVLKFGRGLGEQNGFFAIDQNGSEAMRIDSSGQVGIGTDSPSFPLDVSGSDFVGIHYERSGTSSPALRLSNATTGSLIQVEGSNAGDFIFKNGAGTLSEAMRIDADGNLLLGKASDDDTLTGLVVNDNGFTKIVRHSSTANVNSVLQLNRRTSDGDIIDFRKDGATVGGIGTDSGDLYIGTGAAGLLFVNTTAIKPYHATTNATRDALTDLGDSDSRFKDLYLSGGVYLGGTGSANKLDDYEEGTWTPVYTSGGSNAITVTYDIQVGRYVKVGNMVKATFRIRTDSVTGGSSDTLRVTGLPFSSANVSSMHYGAAIGRRVGWGTKPATAYVQTNQTYLLMIRDGSEGSGTLTQTNDLATGANDNDLDITVVYQTA